MSGTWFRGPEASADGDLYRSLVTAYHAVDPVIRHFPGTGWVMNLDWYKRIRRETGYQPDGEQDEDKWVPVPELDMLLGIPVTVTDDGGAPHIENRNYCLTDFDATGLPAHGGPRRDLRRSPPHRAPVGSPGRVATHDGQAGQVLASRRAAVIRGAAQRWPAAAHGKTR